MEITVKRVPADEADEASYTLVFETEELRVQIGIPAEELVRICKIIIIEETEAKIGLAEAIQDVEIKH